MKFDRRTQTPTTALVLRLQSKISKKSTSKLPLSEQDFFKRVQLKLKEIEKRMPKEPLKDTDMQSVRTTSPVGTPEVSSPFTEVRAHWTLRDDVTKIMGKLSTLSVT